MGTGHADHREVDANRVSPRIVSRQLYCRRNAVRQPVWRESICAENNPHVEIGKEAYFLSADGLLMPAKKDQAPPDLRYFGQARK